MIMDPVYGYESVNVEAQSRSLASLLSWTKRLISVRKSSKVFGRGSLTFIRPANRSVLVYVRQYQEEVILCVANMSRSAQAAEIDLSPWRGRVPLEMLGRTNFPPIGDQPYNVTLAPYGFFWFRLCDQDGSQGTAPVAASEFETLVVTDGWTSLLHGRARGILEHDVLPAYLAGRRWFAERGRRSISARLSGTIALAAGDPGISLALIEAKGERETAQYLLPLTIKWNRIDRARHDPNALAAVRRGPKEGVLLDATADREFIELVLDKLRASDTIESTEGHSLEFHPTTAFQHSEARPIENVRAVETEQSNTTALVDSDYVVKLFRRLEPGVNPEMEIGRFLTETVGFANTPPLLGTVELVDGKTRSAVAVIHRFVENQGEAWSVTNAYLDRFVDEQRLLAAEIPVESDEQAAYLRWMRQTGQRVAEMQLALASRDDIPEFAPEPVTPDDVRSWSEELQRRAGHVLGELTRHLTDLRPADRTLVEKLLLACQSLPERLHDLASHSVDAMKIRHHGDFHLGQMLIVRDDVFIIDFEGEPRRSLEERRRKAPAARDLAGLIRSIDYSTTAALDRALKTTSDEHGKIARALEEWRERSAAAMLAAYREFMTDARLWPSDPQQADRLLDFFLLEKAFYEIEYELAHRPDWLRVPLAGTWRILSRAEGAPA
jgi:maltose alpha-D-glucosyltransferase/alpha-amylase